MSAAAGGGIGLDPVAFDTLAGLDDAGCAAAFATFRRSALAWAARQPALRPALLVDAALATAFAAALTLDAAPGTAAAARFFRDMFIPFRIAADAFFTGYYEPFVDGALVRGGDFTAPLLARPDDLVTFAAEDARPAWAEGLTAARRAADGTLSPYPDRAMIEASIGAAGLRPIAWLRDWVEVFFIHVQGSARVRLDDGRTLRITYAGRNGHPYTSIGRVLAESGIMRADAMSLAGLKAWIRDNGQAPGEAGRALMQRNASYIFFDAAIDSGEDGPTGGAGVPLTPWRSIAVDRSRWSYGLPFHVDAALPLGEGGASIPFRQLVVAQDTGSAIVGPARVDLFTGSGDEAGRLAGGIRHRGTLTVLLPEGTP